MAGFTQNSVSIPALCLGDIETLNSAQSLYDEQGIVYLKDFLCQEDLGSLKKEISESIAKHPTEENPVCFSSKNHSRNGQEKDHASSAYFLESGTKVSFFYESLSGQKRINRIGHGLHLQDEFPSIQKLVYGHPGLVNLLKAVGYKRPICHLSVYIPKFAQQVGSEVHPHQESTFAYTEPQSVTVLWVPLEDATVENACMWGILGSHRWPLKYISRVDHQEGTRSFEKLHDGPIPSFEEQREQYTALAVKAKDALFFHGQFVHCSPRNDSAFSRPALSFQFLETHETIYPRSNWLWPLNDQDIFPLHS